jgi:hypothetical protein
MENAAVPWWIASLTSSESRRRRVSLGPTCPAREGKSTSLSARWTASSLSPPFTFCDCSLSPKAFHATTPLNTLTSRSAGWRQAPIYLLSLLPTLIHLSFPLLLAPHRRKPPAMSTETKSGPMREVIALQSGARRRALRPRGSVTARRRHRRAIPGRGWLQAARGNGFCASSRRRV